MRSRRKFSEWPAWRYGPDGQSAIFNGPEEVPVDWVDSPTKKYEPPEPVQELCKETVIKDLKEYGVDINPTWGKAKLHEIWKEISGD